MLSSSLKGCLMNLQTALDEQNIHTNLRQHCFIVSLPSLLHSLYKEFENLKSFVNFAQKNK